VLWCTLLRVPLLLLLLLLWLVRIQRQGPWL
jgi:hypothetical protein